MYVDGAANQRRSRVEIVVTSPKGIIIENSLRLGFSATNNEAEYEALLEGMTMVQRMGARIMEIFSDSRLVVGQVKGELEVRDTRMQDYLSQVRCLQSGFQSFSLQQVPRSRNMHADSLATLSTSSVQCLPRIILVEDLYKPTEVKEHGSLFTKLGWGLVGWTLLYCFSRMISCSRRKGKLIRCGERLFGSGYPGIKSCTSAPFLGFICYVSILKRWNYS